MSKQKGKDKKADNYEQLEKQFENQKRELIDATFTLKKLQERLNFLTEENHRLESERQNQFLVLNEKIEELSIKNETNEKRLITMRNDLTNSEVENKKLINNISYLQKSLSDERADRSKEFEEIKKNYNFQITKYENMLTDYKLYMAERDSRQKEINELFEAKQIETANRIREVADKEREKVQATDKIRDEMGNKIREMRQNLLSLKKEELETTTRLTMLQNHQLTSQLEYQSNQTERIVFKNEELEATIVKLRQDLEIHKQIEDELAKRAHFSKGIIKKLHAKVQELEQELQTKKARPSHSSNVSEQMSVALNKEKDQKQQRLMAQAMDKELERSQKRYAELYSRYELAVKERDDMKLKWETSQRVKNQLFNVLIRAYAGIAQQPEQDSQSKENQNICLDLSVVKQKHPNQWTSNELQGILQILLLTCQPYLSTQNVAIPPLRKIILFGGDKDKEFQTLLPRLSTQRDKRLMKSGSEKNLDMDEDVCLIAKNQLCQQKYSKTIGSRMVSSKLRQWGRQVPCKNKVTLSKKYQLSSSYRT